MSLTPKKGYVAVSILGVYAYNVICRYIIYYITP